MILREIGRILLRPTDSFEPSGPLKGEVKVVAGGGITSTLSGLRVDNGAGLDPGAQVAFGDRDSRTGWLICEGQAVSRSSNSALFAVIGTTYGLGDGSTTFNVPDHRGVSPIGVL